MSLNKSKLSAENSVSPENTRKALISAAEGGTSDSRGEKTQQAGMAVFGYIIAGIAVWSLIGWGLGSLLGIQWLPVAGALLGLAGGIYLSFMPRFARSTTERSDDDDHDKGAGL
ncbi:hypothetical protein ODZ83_00645 [Acaricomes phytoseiuli]|uniref:hypothetical protein n=1 Tax=Acaricomes phytoseiuli TaxID=291968 RepID=UPI0003828470|nr:hypothetical protein [Acaricomes phytoseiuli]MCW1248721.1 hypothetical protein [Acaricomes phytoseiuli]